LTIVNDDSKKADFLLRGEYDEALKKYKQSMEIDEKIGDQVGIAAALNNIAIILVNKGEYDEALEKYKQSIDINKILGDQRSIANKEKLGDRRGIAYTLAQIGLLYSHMRKKEEAIEFGSLILLDKQILKLQNEAKKQYTDNESKLISKRGEIEDFEKEIKQMEIGFKKELEEEWEQIANQETESNEYKRYNKLDKLSKDIKNYLKIYRKIEELYETKNGKELLLLGEQGKTPTAQISRIVDEAYKYFINSPYLDTCPVCGQEIKFNEVCIQLKNLNLSLSNILNLENELAKISQGIGESNTILSNYTKNYLKMK
jgi:tetratricopeptide (TPR) repeat protein